MIRVYRFFEKVVENIRLLLFVPLLVSYIIASLATLLFDLWGGSITIHELLARSPFLYDPLYLWVVAVFISLATWATTVFAMLLDEDEVGLYGKQRRIYSVARYVLRVADAIGDASFLILYGVFPTKDTYGNIVGGILFLIVCLVSIWGDTLVISFARNPAYLLKIVRVDSTGNGRNSRSSSLPGRSYDMSYQRAGSKNRPTHLEHQTDTKQQHFID